VRGAQIRPSHVFTFYTHAHYRRRSWCPSFGLHSVPNILRVFGSFAGLGPRACASAWPVATFGHSKVSSFIHRRSWPSSLCFRVTIRHLRPPEGGLLHSSQVLGGANYPSVTLAPQYQGPANRLGDVFESGINLRAPSRRSNPQQQCAYIIFMLCYDWYTREKDL